MSARLQDQIIEGIMGGARDTDEHLPFECAAEADLNRAETGNPVEALRTCGSRLTRGCSGPTA
jgi:hypothetical protein